MQMTAIQGRLRVAGLGEADRVLAFYQANRHRFLLPRPETEFEKAVKRGNFFLVEIADRLLAVSGIFDYADGLPYVELAETSVAAEVQGHGIQAVFFRHRIGSVVVSQGPGVTITTAVDRRNTISIENTRRIGFQAWSQPIPEAYASCPHCPSRPAPEVGRLCCCDFYCLPVPKAREAVSTLLQETKSGILTLQRKRPSLVLRSECLFLTGDYRRMLHDFVQGQVW